MNRNDVTKKSLVYTLCDFDFGRNAYESWFLESMTYIHLCIDGSITGYAEIVVFVNVPERILFSISLVVFLFRNKKQMQPNLYRPVFHQRINASFVTIAEMWSSSENKCDSRTIWLDPLSALDALVAIAFIGAIAWGDIVIEMRQMRMSYIEQKQYTMYWLCWVEQSWVELCRVVMFDDVVMAHLT